MHCIVKLFFVFLFSCYLNFLNAQTDTTFWFAVPEATSAHGDRPILLNFTSLNNEAYISIEQPANRSFSPINLYIPANSSIAYDLTSRIEMMECKPGNQVLNYGLLVKSSSFITAYYEIASNFNTDIFALKGRNALGTSFFIPSQNIMNNGNNYSPPANSSFDIVATENNTEITIIPSADIIGHIAAVPFTITLNRGEAYSAVAANNTALNHLMGSKISATKPIAITIKDDSITGGGYANCLDIGGDQIIPVSKLGTKYISLPGYLNNPSSQPTDQVFITATENNTEIRINSIIVATIQSGETYRKPSYNEVLYIETNKPVYALHLSGFGCEIGMALLPQLECSGSRTVGFSRSSNVPLFINLLVPTGGEGNFIFNGSNTVINASDFFDVPFSNGLWKYARIQINLSVLTSGSSAIIKNSTKDFHLGVIHGDVATGCKYGYFSGFNRFEATTISNATNSNPGCSGDSLKLYCDVGASEGIMFSWTGPNGFSSNLQNPIIPNMQAFHSGVYKVIATKIGCNTVIDSTIVTIHVKPSVVLNPVQPICEKQSFQLNANYNNSGTTFLWTGPNGYSSMNENNIINNATTSQSGNYYLATTKDFCTDYDTVLITIKPNPSANISNNTPVCKLSYAELTNNNTLPNSIYMWTGPNGFTSTQQNISFSNLNYSDTGKYILNVSLNGCEVKDSSVIVLKEIPIISFNALQNICEDENAFIINAFENTGIAGNGIFNGNGISNVGLFSPSTAGVGLHTIQYNFTANNGCNATKQQIIEVYAKPIVNAGNNIVIIQNNTAVLNATVIGNDSIIKWTPNYNLSSNTVLKPLASPFQTTIYRLDITNNKGCKGFDEVEVKVLPKIIIPNAFSPNGDGINDKWIIPALLAFPNCKVQIFTRNGKLIYENTGYTTFWDGTYKGKTLPVSTYYYVIQLNDDFLKTSLKGSVTILK
jgi:gliding motility-associated-like protein